MTELINQKEYLKKYLAMGKAPGEKKRKKKKKPGINRLQIIDDDAHANTPNKPVKIPTEEIIFVADDEDAPQIAAIIDERPPSMRIDEKTKNPLWQPIGRASDTEQIEQKPMIKGFKIASKLTGAPGDFSPPRSTRQGYKSLPTINNIVIKEERRSTSPDHTHMPTPRRENTPDASPPRRKDNVDSSPPRRKRDADISPPRRKRDADFSPPRRKHNVDISPPRRKHNEDISPRKRRQNVDISPPRRRNRPSRFDPSPPRKHRRHDRDTDFSPHQRDKNREGSKRTPPRSPNRRKTEEKREPKRMEKTLDGKTAGLQNARDLIQETQNTRSSENNLFNSLSEDVTGRGAETVHRDRKTGRIRNLEEEEEAQRKKREEEEKHKEKYERWGRGLAQVESRDQQMKDQLHEMSKPLARYADDEDLEKFLKEQEREGDPMLAYIRKKKRKKAADAGEVIKPQFEGEFMPNRYGVRPGHRWDGVDRSNGYEKKWFEVQNEKKARLEDSYRWSTEDM